VITPLLYLLRILPFLLGGHHQLALENVALRQQLAIYKRTAARPRLRTTASSPRHDAMLSTRLDETTMRDTHATFEEAA
jgi:hypothetical protein